MLNAYLAAANPMQSSSGVYSFSENSPSANSYSIFPSGIDIIIYFLLFIAISLLIFLVMREVWLWYFKINKIVELLEDIEFNTSNIEKNTRNIDADIDKLVPKKRSNSVTNLRES